MTPCLTLTAGFFIVAVFASSVLAQKPVDVEREFVDYAGPPLSVGAMRDEASAVVIARFTGSKRVHETLRARGDKGLETAFDFKVVEILKNHSQLPLPGGSFEVSLAGGEKDMSNRVRKLVGPPYAVPKVKHRYVVFLRWNQRSNAYILSWGPWAIYDLSGATVKPLLRSANLKLPGDLAPEAFISAARAPR